MKALLYNTKYNINIEKSFTDLELKKEEKLTIDMINHNIVTLRRIINHRASNDILTNFYCSFSERLKGFTAICDMLLEVKEVCFINDMLYKELIIYAAKKTGVYKFIAKDICKNIYKGDD